MIILLGTDLAKKIVIHIAPMDIFEINKFYVGSDCNNIFFNKYLKNLRIY